ncbi:hypothetical protein NHF46_14300 [Arthrobacter alpinus]|nr:hypothetical protein [Arthrobacter alpinus]
MPLPPLTDAGHGAWRRELSTAVRRGQSLPPNMRDSFIIFAEWETPQTPLEWEPHSYPLHELVWARGGTLTTGVGDRIFTLSEEEGLWLPASQIHAGRLAGPHPHEFSQDRVGMSGAIRRELPIEHPLQIRLLFPLGCCAERIGGRRRGAKSGAVAGCGDEDCGIKVGADGHQRAPLSGCSMASMRPMIAPSL